MLSLHKFPFIIKFITNIEIKNMVEPLLFGIVLGMMAVSLLGLFVAAYLQYRRGQDTESLI